jgi:hypothetical protein
MEQLRSIIMDCLEDFFDEDESCPGGGSDERCPELVDSEAALCAIIKGVREELADTKVTLRDFKTAYQDMEKRIAELEKGKMTYVPGLDDTAAKDLFLKLPSNVLDDRFNPGIVFYCR